MAEIALAIGTSHMPGLNNPVEQWFTRAESDRGYIETHGLGDYEELSREKASWIGPEITQERIRERYTACQGAIATLVEVIAAARPDAIVIVGDDHREVFSADHMPPINVHWADEMHVPPFGGRRPGEAQTVQASSAADGNHIFPGEPELARHMIHFLVGEEFDVSHSRTLGAEGLGHAFDFVCRRLMREERIPLVPVLLNTYYPPNQPTAKRCYALGRAIRRAVQSWGSDKRVAVIGTGGLTHHVVDEQMDRAILSAMAEKDEAGLTGFPEDRFVDGTSEIKAWIVVAGAMEEDARQMKLVEYQPCYRSPAGTGCGNAFAYWE